MNLIISVIVPFYNVEQVFDRCLKSIRKQTLSNFEIICVNDCSRDASNQIALYHAQEDPRIRIIEHTVNRGVGAARNTGIKAANAGFLVFVDSDDVIAETMLEKLWEASDQGQFDVVCCGFCGIDQKGNKLREFIYYSREISDIKHINIFLLFNPAMWNKLWKKSLFIDNNITFPIGVYFEDMSTQPRLLIKSKNIKVIKNVLYYYSSKRPDSITNTYGMKHIIDLFKGFELLRRFLNENHLLEKYNKDFIAYVHTVVLNHAKKVSRLCNHELDCTDYFRLLLLQKMSFLEQDSSLPETSSDELLGLLEMKEELQLPFCDTHNNNS